MEHNEKAHVAELLSSLERLLVEIREHTDLPPAIAGDPPQVVCEFPLENERLVLLRFPASDAVELLSPREKEILWLVGEGKSNQAISRALAISPWTVSSYLRRVFAKLGVSTRAEAVALVLRRTCPGVLYQGDRAHAPGGRTAFPGR